MIGQPASQRRLPRRVLSEAGADDVAHDAFVDDAGVDTGAAHGFGDDQRAELGRGQIFQRAEKFPGRRPDRGNENCLTHK